MTDGDALLAAILAAPDEDTPRLVYADWLDENGDPDRAEFIRAQVELARAPALGLRLREVVLLAAHGERWLAPLRENGGPLAHPAAHGQFRRGFVEVVWAPAGWVVTRDENLFAGAPVRELRLTETTPDNFREVLAWPHLLRLHGLDLSDRRLGDAAAAALVGSPYAHALRVLRLRGCGISDAGARLLAEPRFPWPLVELDVAHNPIGPAGLAALRRRFGDAVRAAGREARG
jgi:uncharacterized protein (TIGR02996 family)